LNTKSLFTHQDTNIFFINLKELLHQDLAGRGNKYIDFKVRLEEFCDCLEKNCEFLPLFLLRNPMLTTCWFFFPVFVASGFFFHLFLRWRKRPEFSTSDLQKRKSAARNFRMSCFGYFRVHYAEEGPHAVPRYPGDDGDIPAAVEDVATQLLVAHHLFCDVAGFPSPLDSSIFPNRKYIDVYLFNNPLLSGNGRNFYWPEAAGDPLDPGAQATTIYVRSGLDCTINTTPSHELFHQIQNGMTAITNAWFYEGMARWAAEALDIQTLTPRNRAVPAEVAVKPVEYPLEYRPEHPQNGPPALLDDPALFTRVFSMSYDAAMLLWIPLANFCPDDRIPLPGQDPLLKRRYSNGLPVVHSHTFAGARFMRTLLEELGMVQEKIFRENGYRWGWIGVNRRNPKNNRYIVKAIRNTAMRLCP
jgi:hypothetical protein